MSSGGTLVAQQQQQGARPAAAATAAAAGGERTLQIDASRASDREPAAAAVARALAKLPPAMISGAGGVRSVVLMPDVSYDSKTGAAYGFAIGMKGDTPIRPLLQALPVGGGDGTRLCMGLSAYLIESVDEVMFNSIDTTLNDRVQASLREAMTGIARSVGLVDDGPDGDAAAKALERNLEISIVMHASSSESVHSVVEKWALVVRGNDAVGSAALTRRALSGDDDGNGGAPLSAAAFATACAVLSSNGDVLRNAVACRLGTVLRIKFAAVGAHPNVASQTASPWRSASPSGATVDVVAPHVKNEYNTAVIVNADRDVVLYHKAVAGSTAFGGAIYRHTRTHGMLLIRENGTDGTLRISDASALGAWPLGFARRVPDRAAPIDPVDAVVDVDREFITARRVLWPEHDTPYHGRVLSGTMRHDALTTLSDAKKKAVFNALYGNALYGAGQEKYSKNKYVTKFGWVPGSSAVNMSMPDLLAFIRHFQPQKRTIRYKWAPFMLAFAKFRPRLGYDNADYSLAAIGARETVLGQYLDVDIDLLQQLIDWQDEEEHALLERQQQQQQLLQKKASSKK